MRDDEFWELILEQYEILRRTGLPVGVASAFVKISELRRMCRSKLGRRYIKEFDMLLTELLGTKKYRHAIELSGAPIAGVGTLGLRPVFEYADKPEWPGVKRDFYFIGLDPKRIALPP